MWRWLWSRLRADDAAGTVNADHATAESSRVTVLYAKVKPDALTPPAPQSPALGPEIDDPKDSAPARIRHAAKSQHRVRRFTRRFTDMAPREARLLFAVYRRTVKSLAIESPAVLQRDLHRFVLSSRGQRISGGQAAPSIARVRAWVIESREMITVSSAVDAKRPANLAR